MAGSVHVDWVPVRVGVRMHERVAVSDAVGEQLPLLTGDAVAVSVLEPESLRLTAPEEESVRVPLLEAERGEEVGGHDSVPLWVALGWGLGLAVWVREHVKEPIRDLVALLVCEILTEVLCNIEAVVDGVGVREGRDGVGEKVPERLGEGEGVWLAMVPVMLREKVEERLTDKVCHKLAVPVPVGVGEGDADAVGVLESDHLGESVHDREGLAEGEGDPTDSDRVTV